MQVTVRTMPDSGVDFAGNYLPDGVQVVRGHDGYDVVRSRDRIHVSMPGRLFSASENVLRLSDGRLNQNVGFRIHFGSPLARARRADAPRLV